MLSCNFPLVFTPRPGDPDSVSRDTLADALLAALTAAPAFAPMFVPLALEKLTSTLKCDRVAVQAHLPSVYCIHGIHAAALRIASASHAS